MIGLPSLHAMDRAQGARIWMASEATDMRCGFDRLAERVNAVIGENPQSGHLFVFRSRRGDRLKILVWERDGFVLMELLCLACLAAYFHLRMRRNFPYTASLALPPIPFAEPVYQAREFQQVHHAE